MGGVDFGYLLKYDFEFRTHYPKSDVKIMGLRCQNLIWENNFGNQILKNRNSKIGRTLVPVRHPIFKIIFHDCIKFYFSKSIYKSFTKISHLAMPENFVRQFFLQPLDVFRIKNIFRLKKKN